ncbi:AfsR/SARP family transcriptional regulator, partial [Streptomyces katsurahamanus]
MSAEKADERLTEVQSERATIMEFRLLGPVTVSEAEVPIPLKSTKALELLTALLVTPGHRVSHAGITRFLWPGEKPNANRIRQYFHHLRIGIPGIVQRNDRGFCQITVDPQSVDHLRFHEFQRAADATGDSSVRLKALRAALAEWRGTP